MRALVVLAIAARVAYAEPAIVQLPRQHAIAVTIRAKPTELADQMQRAFLTLLGVAQKQGLDIAGPPFARYTARPSGKQGTFVVEAGLPVTVKPADKLGAKAHALLLPAGPAAVIVFVGRHDALATAHAELDAWLAKTKHVPAGVRWEVYVTNPLMQPDPDKQETRVVAPLAP